MSIIDRYNDQRTSKRLSAVTFAPVGPFKFYRSTVGIVFCGDVLRHQHDVSTLSAKLMERYQSQCWSLGFLDKRLEPQVSFGFPHFSRSNLSLWKTQASGKNASLFLQRKYDVIINIDLTNSIQVHQICADADARHKINIGAALPHLYDLVVGMEEDTEMEIVLEKTLDLFSKIAT